MISTMRLVGLVATAATALALASEGAVAETARHLKGSADMSSTTIQIKIHHNHHQKGYQQAQCNSEANVDYEGYDLKSIQGRKVDQCCGECASTNGCNAWSWNNHNGGTCWLKWGKGKAISKQGVTSATIAPGGSSSGLGRCQVEKDTDYPGFDFKNVQGRKLDQCCGECANTHGCNAWSWSADNGGTCWLKYGKGNAVPKQGVMSAVM